MSRLGPFEENTIVVGDCLDVMARMPDECVDLIVTSPPYNCRKDYGEVGDERPWPEWYDFISDVFSHCWRILREGGTLAFVLPGVIRWQSKHKFAHTWADYDSDYPTHQGKEWDIKGKGRVEPIGFNCFGFMQQLGFRMRAPIIWVKGPEGQAISSDYRMGCDSDPYMRPAHEFILLGSKKRWFHDGGTGRRGAAAVPFIDYTKDVWHIPPVSGKHPAPFPEEIPFRLIRLFVHRANTRDLPEPIVFGCDLNPIFVEMALKRLEHDRLVRSQLSFLPS